MRSPSHATVVAYLALTVALSGSAYAAGQITSAQIKNNTVTSKDIKNKTIKPKDLSAAAKKTLTGPAGPAGPPGSPGAPGSVVVNPTGTPAQNGAELKAKLAALPAASDASPQLVVLGVGHYDAAALFGFTIPPFVTLVGQGPRTVVENTTPNLGSVLTLGNGSVVRDLAVRNNATNGQGINGASSSDNLIEGVTVQARTGVTIRSSILRDTKIVSTSEGLRVLANSPAAVSSEVDNVSVDVTGTGTIIGAVVSGFGRIDGLDVNVVGQPAINAYGLRFVATGPGVLTVRNSDISAFGSSVLSVGVDVDPAGGTPTLYFDGSKAEGVASAVDGIGFRAVGGTSRLGSSAVGGDFGSPGDADLSESPASAARCVDVHDAGYVEQVLC